MEPALSSSFGAAAVAYAEHRPDYAQDAVRWALKPAPGLRILDLGAGTGKLTATLLALGADVTVVEPDLEMLAQLRGALPTVPALPGSAEAIPLPDASVDAVLSGNAMHWFDMDVAAGKERTAGSDPLAGRHQPEGFQAAERGQVGRGEAVSGSSVGHVEVFLMGGVRTPIIGRPRPRRADPRPPAPTPSSGKSRIGQRDKHPGQGGAGDRRARLGHAEQGVSLALSRGGGGEGRGCAKVPVP